MTATTILLLVAMGAGVGFAGSLAVPWLGVARTCLVPAVAFPGATLGEAIAPGLGLPVAVVLAVGTVLVTPRATPSPLLLPGALLLGVLAMDAAPTPTIHLLGKNSPDATLLTACALGLLVVIAVLAVAQRERWVLIVSDPDQARLRGGSRWPYAVLVAVAVGVVVPGFLPAMGVLPGILVLSTPALLARRMAAGWLSMLGFAALFGGISVGLGVAAAEILRVNPATVAALALLLGYTVMEGVAAQRESRNPPRAFSSRL